MKYGIRIGAFVLAVLLMFSMPVLAEGERKILSTPETEYFNFLTDFIIDVYNFDISKDELLSRTIQNLLVSNPEALDVFLSALFGSLDEYSQYYTPVEWRALLSSLEGVFGGVGIRMSNQGRRLVVTSVIEGSPAQAAGILPGDIIMEVDGEDVSEMDHTMAREKITGEIGTTVTIKVQRGEEQLTFEMVRAELIEQTVSYQMLEGDAAYLAITTFNKGTDTEVDEALAELDKLGAKRIVLDLRNNPGGYVDVAANIANHFVPQGTIVTATYKYNDQKEVYSSTLAAPKYELLVLVNEYTASAAEILASAIQDSGAGKLIGRTTYGKAVIQQLYGLYSGPDGQRGCKITTGAYLTRNGSQINEVGIRPDYEVRNQTVKYDEVEKEKMVYAERYALGDSGKGIAVAKQRLSILGYYSGEMGEEYTQQMADAVALFQADVGYEATGELDLNTQIRMENEAIMVNVVFDRQMEKALELFGITVDAAA